jgi:hypothetical protein
MVAKNKALITLIAGIIFIAVAVIISLSIQCPSKVQYFIIYTLTGVGVSMFLPKSSEKTTANFNLPPFNFKLVGSVSLPFILFFTNPIGHFRKDNCDIQLSSTTTTVFVHGKNGRQDMILKKGYVMMDLGEERKKELINDKGQATFSNLHVGDEVRVNIDFSEPYKSIFPDSVYIIQMNGTIYLQVALQGIDKVKGMVLYNELPLSGVTVKLTSRTGDLLDTTTKTGDFFFTVPEEKQATEYKIWFMKDGFKTISAPAYPQTGEPLNIIMGKK